MNKPEMANPGSRGRLLFLLNDAPFFVTHRLSVAIAAQQSGWDVHVCAPYDADAVKTISDAGVTHHDAPLARGGTNPISEAKLLLVYWSLIRRLKPKLVHAVTMKPGAYGGAVARLLGVPALVIAVTGLGFLFLRDTTKTRILRKIVLTLYGFALGHKNARVIFQNPDDRDLFAQHNLIGQTPVHMIKGCGVDLTTFSPAPEPAGPPIVVFPARIIEDKGVHEFLAAARAVKNKGLDARFRLVGRTDADNPTDVGEETIRQWEKLGLVEWQGFATDMPKMFAENHIVCLPSYREGLPRTLIEAAACGRSIVTTDVPGCREVVRDGDNGFLVRARDGAATADAVVKLIENPELRQQMAARGRAIAEAEFSVEMFIEQSLAVYDEVAS